MPKPLIIEHDKARDRVTIEGQVYSGDFFRFFAGAQPGKLFKILSVDGGVIVIKVMETGSPE